MSKKPIKSALLTIPFPRWGFSIAFDVTWIILLPFGIWGIEVYYVAILGAYFAPLQAWGTSLLIGLLVFISLLIHLFAHALGMRVFRLKVPARIPMLVFADAAQVWPVSSSLWDEIILAFTGPFANLLLAGAAYLVWNAQVNAALNVSMPFVALFNVWVAIVNLTPLYPFDAGRVTQLLLTRLQNKPGDLHRTERMAGYFLALGLVGWSLFLFSQGSRFSLETGGATLLFAALIALGLALHPSQIENTPAPKDRTSYFQPWQAVLSGLLVLALSAMAASVLLTNNGIEAPGVALSVEPMVELPEGFSHPYSGTFILTSVISQSPVPLGLWVAGNLTPVIQVLPPEENLPNQLSPQELARQGFEMLHESEVTALAVGLKLAGYPASVTGEGVKVISILPDSHAVGVLQPGDVIIGLDGKPIQTLPDLTNQLLSKKANEVVQITILRDQKQSMVQVKLLPPTGSDNPPRIGITIETAGFKVSLPIAAKIVPQKIVGGPSAGLMFTLTVYNLLTPDDLTGGRKIAGTGTINPDGSVGPIGGVAQKVIAAEAAGAEYFLSPPENFRDAQAVANRIQVVRIATAKEAIAFLKSLPPR